PLLYSGQELPNRKKLEFFEKDPIAWKGQNELHDFYKTLLTLHRENPALRGGDPNVKTYRLQTTHNGHVMAYLRRNGNHEVLVVLNLSNIDPLDIEITDSQLSGKFKDAFSGTETDFSSGKKMQLKEWEYRVFVK